MHHLLVDCVTSAANKEGGEAKTLSLESVNRHGYDTRRLRAARYTPPECTNVRIYGCLDVRMYECMYVCVPTCVCVVFCTGVSSLTFLCRGH